MASKFDAEPRRHGHTHAAAWVERRRKLELANNGAVCGTVEWSDEYAAWTWWCSREGCGEHDQAAGYADAWSDFLGHEWITHLAPVLADA